ncbi:hypothetical protein H6G17_27475 [Chroococcidiopsis sp. FACHB-1243]|uniref:hypothetical protein n=1 Tax=Chroococcidiopsis sp. [FACHB-1243] TaxID=2692781 RepID=UPI0017876E00|nr:hypothetical protein [Chroococcidiopsis sp. [FACHB-1243]]MBD2309204.1 hypothetical protein [Chroococcidiopsis sp. [FACHB-1243]]
MHHRLQQSISAQNPPVPGSEIGNCGGFSKYGDSINRKSLLKTRPRLNLSIQSTGNAAANIGI